MKRKTFVMLLGIVFAALMILAWFVAGFPTVFSSALAFPFEQLGAGLRALALTGNFGNGLAFALWMALSVLPALFALRHKGEKPFRGENIVLCCTSVVVCVTLFWMANPSKLLAVFPYLTGEFLPVAKGVLGCTVWSFLVLWLVLRLVRMSRSGDTHELLRYLRAALYALCLLFDAVIALSCGSALYKDLSAVQQSMDGVLAVLRFLASVLPYALDIGITLSLLTLLDAFAAGREEDTVKHADSLAHRCCIALGLTAASTAALNVIQLLFSHFLSDISVHVDLPLVSLAFLLLILLLSRLIVENRKLQSDNDLFI